MSTLKVGTIQDHANSNTAISIDSSGRTTFPQKIAFKSGIATNFNPNTAARTKVPFVLVD